MDFVIVAADREPNRHTYFMECWSCGHPTMRVDEIQSYDFDGYKVIEHCHAEQCDHYNEYWESWD